MPEDYESYEEIKKKREKSEKKKKLLVRGVCAVAGIFAAFGAVTLALSAYSAYLKDKARKQIEEKTPMGYVYPTPDYDLNILKDEGYMAKDRDIWFDDGGFKTVITERNYTTYNPEVQFMYNVVNLIIKGDYVEYNKIFTEEYKKNAGDDLRERFTMQQLFSIELQYVGYRESGKVKYSDIMLTYMIRNNDGTFRTDLDYNDEGAIPVVYRLVSDSSGIKVAGLLTYYKYASGLYE